MNYNERKKRSKDRGKQKVYYIAYCDENGIPYIGDDIPVTLCSKKGEN